MSEIVAPKLEDCYYLGGLESVYSQCVYQFRPWEAWELQVDGQTKKLQCYTGVFGRKNTLRISLENPSAYIKGVVLDYDLPWKDDYLPILKKLSAPPAFVSISRSGNFHLVWLYGGKLICQRRKRWCSAFFERLADEWNAIFSQAIQIPVKMDVAALRESQIFVHTGQWLFVEHPQASKKWLEDLYEQANHRRLVIEASHNGGRMSIEQAHEILKNYRSFTWPGKFVDGERGPSWWLAGSDSTDSAIIRPYGMVTFSSCAEKACYGWEEVIKLTAALDGEDPPENLQICFAAKPKALEPKSKIQIELPPEPDSSASPPIGNGSEPNCPGLAEYRTYKISKEKKSGSPQQEEAGEESENIREALVEQVMQHLYMVEGGASKCVLIDYSGGDSEIYGLQSAALYDFKILLSRIFHTTRDENAVIVRRLFMQGERVLARYIPGFSYGYQPLDGFASIGLFNRWHPSMLPVSSPPDQPPKYGEGFPFIAEFFEKTFPNKTARTYILAWLAQFYQSYAYTTPTPSRIMVICGPPQSGKTFLVSYIMSRLFGRCDAIDDLLNYQRASQSTIYRSMDAESLPAILYWDDMSDVLPYSNADRAGYSPFNRALQQTLLFMLNRHWYMTVVRGQRVRLPWSGRAIISIRPQTQCRHIVNALKDPSMQEHISFISTGDYNWKRAQVTRQFMEGRTEEELKSFATWLLTVNLYEWAPELVDDTNYYGLVNVRDNDMFYRLPDSELNTMFYLITGILADHLTSRGDIVKLHFTEIARIINNDEATRYLASRDPHSIYSILVQLANMFSKHFRTCGDGCFEISLAGRLTPAETGA